MYVPTPQELAFDPTVSDKDAFVTTQYKYDYPCTYEVSRDTADGKTVQNYYFWVKNKTVPAPGNIIPIIQVAQLLKQHNGVYAVPQAFKFYNQLDARPNRYGLLSVRDLGRYVRHVDAYKLRLTRDPTLRDNDLNLDLKNTHVEWKLLRALSPTVLPQNLWDLLTNSLIGATPLGQTLPFSPLADYDARNNTTVRYGFDAQQIFVDPKIAKATVKSTILNTRVDKYLNGELVPDYIDYAGFNINLIDDYLSSDVNIRKFMSDLWRFANPKQINEIFFAVLEDAAAENLELTDFFKTSFISLSEIRVTPTGS
jgi:hypothetical protein